MSKNHKKDESTSGKQWSVQRLALLFIILTVAIVFLLVVVDGNRKNIENQTGSLEDVLGTSELGSEEEHQIILPWMSEDGKLEVSSLFPYTGMNPDRDNEEGTDIGGLVLTNRSDQHLAHVELTVQLMDGAVLEFVAEDVPAGQTVWIFDKNNSSLNEAVECSEIECDAVFEQKTELMVDQLAVQHEGMDITLTNISKKKLKNLEVICHCLLGDAYFGGVTYTYPVAKLAPGENITFTAADCVLGDAEIVWIAPAD